MNSGLTPEQERQAVEAARAARWNDKQVERWDKVYRKTVAGGDFEKATEIARLIELHRQTANEARRKLKELGL